jgi:hypothetical protein
MIFANPVLDLVLKDKSNELHTTKCSWLPSFSCFWISCIFGHPHRVVDHNKFSCIEEKAGRASYEEEGKGKSSSFANVFVDFVSDLILTARDMKEKTAGYERGTT